MKKSVASTSFAWARKNSLQVGPARRGAGGNAFALGERTGVLMASMPIEASTASNDEVNLVAVASQDVGDGALRYRDAKLLRRCQVAPGEKQGLSVDDTWVLGLVVAVASVHDRDRSAFISSRRQRSGKPERRENDILEARHRADPVAREGEDINAHSMTDIGRPAQVNPEGRLTISPRRHQVIRSARVEEAGTEAGNDVSALVLERHRWHRDKHVVGEESHEHVKFSGFPRLRELGHDRILSW